ncbi:hypothetical protein [Leuconostoc citreum]|uniref:hypothetical protein n=1 Tax=Leuconostoc citreum TaxID=33964 RepID=UPI0032DF427C
MRDKLFRRYANPLIVLETISPDALVDFILFIFDTQDEEELYNIWLHKDIDKPFDEITKSLKKRRGNKNTSSDVLTANEAIERIKKAGTLIKPNEKEENS